MSSRSECLDCGSSDGLAEFENGTFCFSCKKSTYHKGTWVGFRDKNKQNFNIIKELPQDYTIANIPQDGLNWLYSSGLDKQLILDYNIGYSYEWQRVIIPSYFKHTLLGWQGRAIWKDQQPKYIQGKNQKPILFYSKKAQEKELPYVVLVEDALSAIIVGQVMPTIALMGTSLDREGKKLELLLKASNRFIIWLDGDKPGRIAARKLVRKLDSYRVEVNAFCTTKDPKLTRLDTIQSMLEFYISGFII